MEGVMRMTIALIDDRGNRRYILVSRQETLLELLKRSTAEANVIIRGEKVFGPENYNNTLEELDINPGADIEVVRNFDGGKN